MNLLFSTETAEPPTEWPRVALGDVCTVVSGATPKTKVPEFWDGDIAWITPTDLGKMDDRDITGSDRAITEAGFESCSTTLMEPGAVVMSSRAPIGHLGIARIPLCTNQGCKSFVPGPDVDTDYLYYALLFSVPAIQDLGTGATFKEVSKSKLTRFQIPLPSLDTQREVATTLQAQLELVSEARLQLEAQLAAAESLPGAYLTQAFRGVEASRRRGVEASRWPIVRLGEVLIRRTEIVHPRDQPAGPATFVGLEHIDKGTGVRLGSEPVEKSELTGRRAQFYEGDVVYGYLRPYLNKVWVAEFDGLCSVDQYVYTYDAERVDSEYVSAFMRSPVFLERAPVGDSPGQLPRIRSGEVDAVELTLPPLDVQRRVAADLRQRRAGVQSLLGDLARQINAVSALPDSILREAFVESA